MTMHANLPVVPRQWRPRHVASRPDPASVRLRLATLLHLKAEDDPVPLAAWWFVVASLEGAVIVRQVMAGVEPPPAAGVARDVERSQRAARAALEELGMSGAEFTPVGATVAHVEPLSVLRLTIHQLSMMTVRSRATPIQQLSRALVCHLDGLSRCQGVVAP